MKWNVYSLNGWLENKVGCVTEDCNIIVDLVWGGEGGQTPGLSVWPAS